MGSDSSSEKVSLNIILLYYNIFLITDASKIGRKSERTI